MTERLARQTRLILGGLLLSLTAAVAACQPAADAPETAAPPETTIVESPAAASPVHGSTASRNATPQTEPKPLVEIAISGPKQAAVGDEVTFVLVITNRGTIPAAGLLVNDRFDPGLEHDVSASPIERDLEDLAPGASRRLGVSFRVTRPGALSNHAEVRAGEHVLATARATVVVAEATDDPEAEGDVSALDPIPPPVAEPEPEAPSYDHPPETARDLGEPLVDDPNRLTKLHPNYPVWIDRVAKQVVVLGEVCQRRAPLELFVCLRGSKEHEAVVVVDTKAYVVHAGLMAVGGEPGHPVQFQPDFAPASGPEIEVTVVWRDQQGRRRSLRGQDWVHDVAGLYRTLDGVVANPVDEELSLGDDWAAWKSMSYVWVFAGSRFVKDERTGEQYYYADVEGDLICVSNFPSAVLDVPFRSTDSNTGLLFHSFTERIPPAGTPVTLLLAPRPQEPGDEVGSE
ncbi:MAG: YdjY domain-containing protein [Planctomycetota bacterium]|jgi:uncharacterized repeat protein (TIGR01451 family)